MKKLLWYDVRTFFGLRRSHLYCRKCKWKLEPGDNYHRYVYRIDRGKHSRLIIEYEHDYGCDYDPSTDKDSGMVSRSGTQSSRILFFPKKRRRKVA